MAPRGLNRKVIEKYFDFGDETATCKLCNHALKSYRIFNLKTHVMKVHKIKEEEFITRESPNIEKKVKKISFKIQISKKELLRSYIGLVTEDSVPLNVLNSENFRNIIDPICKGLSDKLDEKFSLNSESCQQVLQLSAYNIRNELKRDLNKRLLSLKIDSLNSLSENLFSLSAQFIKNGDIKSHVLGMVEWKGSLAEEAIKNFEKEILNTLSKYDINIGQIVCITSDIRMNPSSNTNSIPSSSLIIEDKDLDYDNDIYIKKIQTFENFLKITIGDIPVEKSASYLAQVCSLDLAKNEEIKNLLITCRNLVKCIRKPPNGYREDFEEEGLVMPQIDCPTNFGSTFSMVNLLRNSKFIINGLKTIKNEFAEERFDLSENFWNFIEAYCIVLEPLHKLLNKCQEEQLHFGNFYAEWLKSKLCTEKIHAKADKYYIQLLSQILIHSLETREKQLMNNKHLMACLYLDPRFQHTLNVHQKFEAALYLKKLHERIKVANQFNSQITNELPSTSIKLEKMENSEWGDDYLNEYLTRNFVPKSNEEVEVSTKIENLLLPFLRVESNVLHFWKDKEYSDPELCALSNVCFAVPATQVSVENLFLSLKYILADKRYPLNNDLLENILLVKLNSSYLDQAIDDLPLFEDDE